MANPLGALFAFFFKYRPAVFQQGDFTFGAPAPMAIMLLIGAAIAVPAVLSYARVRGKSSPRDRMILRGLRIAALVVLIVCLLRPMLLLNAAVPQRNFVGVLIDDSRSMQIADRGGRQRADWIRDSVTAENSALVKSLRERFQVKLFHFGATAEKLDDPATLKFDANETKLGAALEGARRELEMVPLSGLVVLTDGADNSRAPIADELLSLRARQVPVFTVGIGSEKFARDIEVRRVEMSSSVLKGEARSWLRRARAAARLRRRETAVDGRRRRAAHRPVGNHAASGRRRRTRPRRGVDVDGGRATAQYVPDSAAERRAGHAEQCAAGARARARCARENFVRRGRAALRDAFRSRGDRSGLESPAFVAPQRTGRQEISA